MQDFQTAVEKRIGKDYVDWTYNDRIFINAPTGSGKTTFILYTLLPHYSVQKKKILYLVNRRILKEQIRDMISDLPHKESRFISVMLYQEIERIVLAVSDRHEENKEKVKKEEKKEKTSRQGYDYRLLGNLKEYDCVVCDECHYFLMDATYNTNTVFSFRWIQDIFQNRLCIFMSATIRELKSYMDMNNKLECERVNTAYYEIPKYDPSIDQLSHQIKASKGQELSEKEKQHEIKTYEIPRNYNYIKPQNIRIIKNRERLVDIVAEGNHKWLIFIDNINYGKVLRNSIIKRMRALERKEPSESINGKVRLITSGYKQDQDAVDEVDRIISTQAPSAKVLIVTSVLDNGVNIRDIDVRNVVLFADTETEFIQMLGRKRQDTEQFKLYIYGYDKKHFDDRKRQLRQQKKIADRYLRDVEEEIDGLKKEDDSKSWGDDVNRHRLNASEEECIKNQHKKMMQYLFDGHIRYEDLRRAFTVYDGNIHLNRLSFQHIENLIIYFQDIIRKFEKEGEDAFSREQLRWIGKTGEIAERIIRQSKQMEEIESRKRVIASLSEIVGKKKLREEFSKFTDRIIKDLRTVAAQPVDFPDEKKRTNEQLEKWNTVKSEFNKTGKVISKQSMEFLRTYCRIPFQLETDGKGGYTVQQVGLYKNKVQ